MSLLSSLNCMRDCFRSASQSLRFKKKKFQHSFAWRTLRHQKFYSYVLRSKEVEFQVIPVSPSLLFIVTYFFVRKGLTWPLLASNLTCGWWFWTSDSLPNCVNGVGVQPEPGACQANILPTELHLPSFVSTSSFPDQSSISLYRQIKKLLFQALHVPIIYIYIICILYTCQHCEAMTEYVCLTPDLEAMLEICTPLLRL